MIHKERIYELDDPPVPYSANNGRFILDPKPTSLILKCLRDDSEVSCDPSWNLNNFAIPEKGFWYRGSMIVAEIIEDSSGMSHIRFIRDSYVEKKKLVITGKVFERGIPKKKHPYFHKKQQKNVRRGLTLLFGERLWTLRFYYPGSGGPWQRWRCMNPVIHIHYLLGEEIACSGKPPEKATQAMADIVEKLLKQLYGEGCIRKIFRRKGNSPGMRSSILNVHLDQEWFIGRQKDFFKEL